MLLAETAARSGANMSAPPPDLMRLVLTADGAVKANFADNSILVLSSSGHAFVSMQPDGHQQRQLSEFALHRHVAALAVVLEFRNMHADQPCICDRVARASPREGLKLGFRMSDLWWHRSVDEALFKNLLELLDDGKIAVSTEDGAGRIVLHQHRRRFAICYPLLTGEHPQEGTYEYVWQTQVFSLLCYPPRWAPAVELVVQAAERLAPQHQQQQQAGQESQWDVRRHAQEYDQRRDASCHPPEPAAAVTAAAAPQHQHQHRHQLALTTTSTTSQTITTIAATGAAPASSPSPRAELPTAVRRSVGAGAHDRCPSDGWWCEQTLTLLPDTDLVLLEWTPEATYQYHPDLREVEVWVHQDESCLASSKQGRFVSHHRPPTRQEDGTLGPVTEQLFLADCVPESVWGGKAQAGRYSLAPLVAHAVKLRHQMSAVASRLAASEGQAHAGSRSCVSGQPLWPMDASTSGRPSDTPAVVGSGAGLPSSQVEATFAVVSEEVLDEAHVPGQGVFTAYADGRVRAIFEDRTILHMNAPRSHCKVVLPDGEMMLVSTSQPVGVDGYVEATLCFLDWAMKPVATREEEAQARAYVQAELNSLQRMNTILDWTTSKTRQTAIAAPSINNTSSSAVAVTHNRDAYPGPPHHEHDQSANRFSMADVEAMLRRNQDLLHRL